VKKEFYSVECLKLIQIGLQYVVPRLKHTEEIKEEFPTEFQIEIIDKISDVDK
jgi:hypothetical protein